MSDTYGADDQSQSIDDQAETASGGLTNDMSGLPMSPPGRGMPSALGGIASAAQRLFQGGPAPQPAQRGPSPWQAPGQSQMPQQPGPRWQGNTASLFLHKGAQQPRASFTPFMRGPPTTSIHQWGNFDPNDSLPQPFEGPSLYQNTSKFFGQNGSAAIIPLALSMGKNAGAFVQGVMQGQEWKAKMHRQQMLDDAYELEQKQQKEMYTYYDTASEYESSKGVGTAPEVGSYAIGGRTLLDAWEDEANRLGDDKFLAVLSTGSVEKALDFLHKRNDNWQTLAKTNKSVEKQTEEDNGKEWGVPPGYSGEQGAGASDRSFTLHGQQQQQGQVGAIPQGGPAAIMKPLGPNGTLAQFQEAGQENFREGTSLNNVPKGPARNAAAEYSRGLGSAMNEIARKARNGTLQPEQIPDELDKLIPGAGADFEDVSKGAPLPTGATGRTPYWMTMRSLIPGFNPIMQQTTIRDFSPGGKDAARVTAGVRMSDAAITVLKEMKNFKEGELPPQNIIDQWIATGVTGDPKWSNLFAAVNTYMQEHQSLQSPTGRFFESEMQEQRKNLHITAGLPAIRGLLKVDARNAAPLVDQLRDNYQRGSRDFKNDPPTYDPVKVQVLKAIANLDEYKGFGDIPEDNLPPPLRGLGLGGGVLPTATPDDGFSNFKVNP